MNPVWDPKKEPFRVVWVKVDATALHGWYTEVRTFASLEEAAEAARALFGRGVRECYITEDVGEHRRIIGERRRKRPLQLKAPRR